MGGAGSFAIAVDQGRTAGVPEFPRAWIIQTARYKAIDRLRLIFTCCHPSLALEAQVAPALRTLGGLTTDEIANAFLVPTATWRSDWYAPCIRFATRLSPMRRPEAIRLGCLMRTLMAPAGRRSVPGRPGPLAVQAAIAALHCRSARAEDTDVSLNRAVAVATVHGLRPALALIDALAAFGNVDGYHLLHSARADLSRRADSFEEAAKSYAGAPTLVTNDSERRFLERRLREVQF
jgi:predicted RNA polymerase sigma factor